MPLLVIIFRNLYKFLFWGIYLKMRASELNQVFFTTELDLGTRGPFLKKLGLVCLGLRGKRLLEPSWKVFFGKYLTTFHCFEGAFRRK